MHCKGKNPKKIPYIWPYKNDTDLEIHVKECWTISSVLYSELHDIHGPYIKKS